MSANNSRMPQPGGRKIRYDMLAYGLIAVILFGFFLFNPSGNPAAADWEMVRGMIRQGDVEKITVVMNDGVAQIHLTQNGYEKYSKQKEYAAIPQDGPQFTYTYLTAEILNEDIKAAEQEFGKTVKVEVDKRRDIWSSVLLNMLLPIIVLVGIWMLIMRSMSKGAGGGAGGVFNVGKAKAQVFDKENSVKITFKDVAGLEEAKVEIMEIVDFLKKPQKYKDLGGKIPKGALLVGPPGTGKTLLAKAVAGEANVPFFSISGSDFVEMFVGVGASRVRDLFRQAKEKSPCIVFIDEIDAIGRARGKNVGYSSNDERENTLNQLLTEMDGFGTNAGVIILAATNRADILDKALMRAGRFDRQIEVGLPDIKERREIFDVHLKNIKLVKDLDRDFLAKQTPGFSGADIANVCNEAALIAARNNKKAVDKEDFLNAIDRIVGGLERRNKVFTKEEKRAIAYHEAGHAIVSWMLEDADPLIKVTIIPRGQSLGASWYLPEERQITTKEHLMDKMASLLGGRASEELTFSRISTGALNDLERATKLAYAMVAYYGMSDKVKNLSYYDSTGQSEMGFTKPYSEKTAEDIDAETKALIDKAYDTALDILRKHSKGLKTLAERLIEREVVFTEDLEEIFGKRKKDLVKEEEDRIEREMRQHDEAAAEVKELEDKESGVNEFDKKESGKREYGGEDVGQPEEKKKTGKTQKEA